MKLEYEVKKTTEFSDSDKEQFLSLFQQVYETPKAVRRFEQQFLNTPVGYSHHALAYDDTDLVAAYTIVPQRYRIGGVETLLGLSVDTMVASSCRRDPLITARLSGMLEPQLREESMAAILGMPNDNFYEYSKRLMRFRDIGVLDFLVLPLRPGSFASILKPLNWTVPKVAPRIVGCFGWASPAGNDGAYVEKVDDDGFRRARYDHRHVWLENSGDCDVVYSLHPESGKTVAYIVDVVPFDSRNLYRAFASVAEATRKSADIVAYCGNPSFFSPLRVPQPILPRHLRLIGKLLDTRLDEKRFFSLHHWHVNLSNFDVR
jgi:GNAT acetyltransferase-like protein